MTKARDNANGGLGLILIKPSTVVGGTDNGKGTVAFSASTSVSLNDVFSSTYDNYRVVLEVNSCSVSPVEIKWQFRKLGTNNSTGYYSSATYTYFGGTTAVKYFGQNQSSGILLSAGSTRFATTFDVINPRIGKARLTGTSALGGPHDAGLFMVMYHDVVDTFDGLTIFPASGNMSGSISVYGYNK